MDVLAFCDFCTKPVDPTDRKTYRRVVGYERPRDAGGTNAVALREVEDRYAHPWCIERAKSGVAIEQETFL